MVLALNFRGRCRRLQEWLEGLHNNAHVWTEFCLVLYAQCCHSSKLCNSFWRIFPFEFWIYALFHFIFTQSWGGLKDKALLPTRHGMVHGFPSRQKFKQDNPKTIYITLLS
nr:hypothetical protein Iba_chr06dCG9720 [Ipomoea batatas]